MLIVPCSSRPALADQSSKVEDVVAPLVAMPIASPNPVLGADDKIHLAYELVVMNVAPYGITLKTIETKSFASRALSVEVVDLVTGKTFICAGS
jgi:hypothetical protein